MAEIWILAQQREGIFEDATFGLVGEARRLLGDLNSDQNITAVVTGAASTEDLNILGGYGVNEIVHLTGRCLADYHGELLARLLFEQASQRQPQCILAAQSPETDDLCPRLAALLETVLVKRAMDLKLDGDGQASVMRPVGNGYLFEEVSFDWGPKPPIVSFLPPVLFDTAPDQEASPVVDQMAVDTLPADLSTHIAEIIEAAPEDLDLEDADVIIAAGRGVGKGEAFDVIHAMAQTIGGTVGATRPIIDWGLLPYERQIGQTGKYVSPRLIINCGISGANEYTAGMEKANQVIAIDLNPRARIFRFADIGVVGDVHAILPPLIERLNQIKNETRADTNQ